MADPSEFPNLRVLDHPLVQDKLSNMRMKDTPTAVFRQLLRELTPLIAYEATHDLPMATRHIETALAEMEAPVLADGPPVIVSILRAGLGMAQALHELMPNAPEGHIGLRRDEVTKQPIEYVVSLPSLAGQRVLMADPMIATGHSAVRAVDVLNEHGVADSQVRFVALVCAPEGMRRFQEAHPDTRVYAAALDDHLDADAFIVPGLGDAGDRLFGTQP
ncbi:MAG: uracil phosphoribosyltransferase [Alphaproteobacteria bacterium]|nr:uracil phosphoribosyltransferase [Alphaproteobacteria bacterium]